MSQNNSRSVRVYTVRRTCRLKERASDHSSSSRAHRNASDPTAVYLNTPIPKNNQSAPEGRQVSEKSLAAPATYERTIAAFTLRAGGRVLNVAMKADGSTENHLEMFSSERLTLEQWAQLYEKVQELAHNMISMDHSDD